MADYTKYSNQNKPVKLEKAIAGNVTPAKKKTTVNTVSKSFFENDLKEAVGFLAKEYVVPGIKDAIIGGMEYMFYGKTRGQRTTNNRGTTYNYNSIYSSSSSNKAVASYAQNQKMKSQFDWSDLSMDTEEDAIIARDTLIEAISMYGKATVGNLFDVVGVTVPVDSPPWTFEKYGWYEFATAKIVSVRVSPGVFRYYIDPPRPVYLGEQ